MFELPFAAHLGVLQTIAPKILGLRARRGARSISRRSRRRRFARRLGTSRITTREPRFLRTGLWRAPEARSRSGPLTSLLCCRPGGLNLARLSLAVPRRPRTFLATHRTKTPEGETAAG